MDPLSIIGSIIAVVQLSGAVISICYDYRKEARRAPGEPKRITDELTALQKILEKLIEIAENENADHGSQLSSLKLLNEPEGPLAMCQVELTSLKAKLEPSVRRGAALRALNWPLKELETRRSLETISRIKETLTLALTADQTAMILEIHNNITTMVGKDKSSASDEMKEKIRIWLAAPNPSSNHHAARREHQRETGKWLTEGSQFKNWKSLSGSFLWLHGIPGCGKTVLSSTAIHEVMLHCDCDPALAVAYFYFDFNDPQKRKYPNLLRSLLTQMLMQSPDISTELEKLHSSDMKGHHHPTTDSTDSMITTLQHMMNEFDHVYIIVDALDECEDRDELLKFLKTMKTWESKTHHVLVTSRKEQDIDDSIGATVTDQICIQSGLVDPDIRIYVEERLKHDDRLNKWPAEVRCEIEKVIMEGVAGMFRWAVCQMDTLRICLKVNDLNKALRSLPKTLDDTYARILANIEDEYSEDAVRVFQMLCFSCRPVLLCEIVDVLAIELQDHFRFDPQQRLPHPQDIKLVCSTLVDIVPAIARTGYSGAEKPVEEIKFAHYSVKEYLISRRASIERTDRYHAVGSCGNVSIAQTCLVYLLYFDDPEIITPDTLERFPFYRYSAKYWIQHYNSVSDPDCTYMCIRLFTAKQHCLENWLRVCDPDKPHDRFVYSAIPKFAPPLYYASLCGLSDIVELLLQKADDVNALGGADGSALQAAAHHGYTKIIHSLLEHGADVNMVGGQYGNALVAACKNGHVDVAEQLLQHGANINQSNGYHENALLAACAIGSRELFELLLKKGADVNWQNEECGSVLDRASAGGRTDLVKRLLEEGANVEGSIEEDWSALRTASSRGHKEIVELLLKHGADVNASNEGNGSALQAASFRGHKEIVELLLKHGADINASSEENGTALQCASHSGYKDVVELLLTSNPDVNANGGRDGSALTSASRGGQTNIVELLLKAGADVNIKGKYGGDALAGASEIGHIEILETLLKNGADVNESPNALALASRISHFPIVKRLLEKGADVKSQGGLPGRKALENAFLGATGVTFHEIPRKRKKPTFCRAHKNDIIELLLHSGVDIKAENGKFASRLLMIAVEGGDVDGIKWLIKNGTNVNVQVENFGEFTNALEMACLAGNLEVVELLLEERANVQPQVGEYGGLLHAVSFGQNPYVGLTMILSPKNWSSKSSTHESERNLERTKITERLLREGADPNAQGGRYCNALQTAAFLGQSEIVKLLLDHGADVNMQGGQFGNAIQAACYNSHQDVVEQLLERNADVNAPGRFWGNALQVASWTGHKQIVELLLRNGADIHGVGKGVGNALQVASREGHREICSMLLKAGANEKTQDEVTSDAMRHYSSRAHYDITKEMMEKFRGRSEQSGLTILTL